MDGDHCILEVSDQHYPLVLARVVGSPDEQHANQLVAAFDAVFDHAVAAERRGYLVFDGRDVENITPRFRQIVSAWEAAMSAERYERIIVRVVVHNNTLVRGAIKAMSWFSPRMRNLVMSKDTDSTIAALEKGLAEHGGMTPEHVALVRKWLTPGA